MPGSPRFLFAMDQRGTVRRTICVGSWAAKIARNGTGRRCNSFEADLWGRVAFVKVPPPCLEMGELACGNPPLWQRRSNIWRKETSPARGAKRLSLRERCARGIFLCHHDPHQLPRQEKAPGGRIRTNTLHCDHCGFDPAARVDAKIIKTARKVGRKKIKLFVQD
jgi:hypothetical protein